LELIAVIDIDNCLFHFDHNAITPFLERQKRGELLDYYSEEVYYAIHRPIVGAKLAVATLVELGFKVYALTSRFTNTYRLTHGLIDLHFAGLISKVFYEIWFVEPATAHYASHKGIAARELGAVILIDDTPVHVLAAVESEIRLPILFADSLKGRGITLPSPAVRAPDWDIAIQLIRDEFRL